MRQVQSLSTEKQNNNTYLRLILLRVCEGLTRCEMMSHTKVLGVGSPGPKPWVRRTLSGWVLVHVPSLKSALNDLALRPEYLERLTASIKPTWYVNSRGGYLHDCSPFAGWNLTSQDEHMPEFKCFPDCREEGKKSLFRVYVFKTRRATGSAEKRLQSFEGK